MIDRTRLNDLKAAALKKRRQRIRRSTYARVAEAMIEDTAPQNPFRHRLVLDWWNRVVDPLDAEKYDAERLRYFRLRLQEHRSSTSHNAALRQGEKLGKPLRRLNARHLAYVQYQIRRIADRGLNYAAAERAVSENDHAFEQLALGLVALPELRPRPFGRLEAIVFWACNDRRFSALAERLRNDPSTVLPDVAPMRIKERVTQLTDRFDPVWLFAEDYASTKREEALIRKLEDEYINNI